jgi:glutathione S-transferase
MSTPAPGAGGGPVGVEIHGYIGCPFAWRVRLAAAEKGVAAEFFPCDVDDPDPRVRAHNPDEHSPLLYHHVAMPGAAPVVLTESLVIAQYLDEAFEGRPLMPAAAQKRARLRLTEIELRALDVHNERARPEARRRSEGALAALEQRLCLDPVAPFLHGAEPGLTDVMIWPFLADIQLRRLLDPARHPRVDVYLDRARGRPSFRATRTPWAATL